MEVKENLPIMVLTHESPHQLLFQFNSTLWGYLTLAIGIILGIATYFALLRDDASWMIVMIFGVFSLLFLYSSLYSFKLRRSLAIDTIQQVVKYEEASLYKAIKWRKDFQSFKDIKTFRRRDRHASNWSIQLTSNEDEVFAIGYNQFGAMSRQKAEELLNRIAAMMNVRKEIIDEE